MTRHVAPFLHVHRNFRPPPSPRLLRVQHRNSRGHHWEGHEFHSCLARAYATAALAAAGSRRISAPTHKYS
jgi:hypothetical protein